MAALPCLMSAVDHGLSRRRQLALPSFRFSDVRPAPRQQQHPDELNDLISSSHPTTTIPILACRNTRSTTATTTIHLSTPGWLVPTTPQRQIQRSPSGPAFIGTHLDSFVLLASLGSGAEPLSSSGDLSLFHVSTAALSTCHPFVLISTSRTPTMGEAYETPGRHPITMSPAPLATPASASIPSPPPCIVPSTASTPRVHVACFSMCA